MSPGVSAVDVDCLDGVFWNRLTIGFSAVVTVIAMLPLTLGIAIQNFPEGAAISLPLYQGGTSRRRAFLTGAASGSVEPVFGMAAMLVAGSAAVIMPWLLGFAAGAMLYVTSDEMIPETHAHGYQKLATYAMLVGFMVLVFLAD